MFNLSLAVPFKAKPSDISKSQAEIFALVWTRLGPLHDRRPSIHLVNEQRALRARCVAVAAAAGITHNSGEEATRRRRCPSPSSPLPRDKAAYCPFPTFSRSPVIV